MYLLDKLRRVHRSDRYDPLAGIGGIGKRVPAHAPDGTDVLLPAAMADDSEYSPDMPAVQWRRLRCRHDFEYWCAACVVIKDKLSGRNVPFVLNVPQRRVAATLESDRLAGRPLRLIMLKARQWGGSTLVQIYMAWIQCCHRQNWHSLICAHVKDISASIRGMYTKLLDNYPAELWPWEGAPAFRPFERSANTRCIEGTGCHVTVASAENYESLRGADYAMAHLSEAAFWPHTPGKSPEALIRAVNGAIAMAPYTLVAIESTANGVGNFFHSEWLRSRAGLSDKHAVFVPWYEIEIYRLEPPSVHDVLDDLSPYEAMLWNLGLASDQIWWYRCKLRECGSVRQMFAEYPTTDTEAFSGTGTGVFAAGQVERLRAACMPPVAQGDVSADGTAFIPSPQGRTLVWQKPDKRKDYVVAVDVGGRSDKSDWSVIAVLTAGDKPEVVAQWRGHIDHDLLAAEAERMARYYNGALLVIESNTFETENYGAGGADPNLFVLARLAERYPNIYRRRSFDRFSGRERSLIGFHTNRATKTMLISNLIEAVREGLYVERCNMACNELLVYRQLQNGSYAAAEGQHDDILMTRAIALLVIKNEMSDVRADNMPSQSSW